MSNEFRDVIEPNNLDRDSNPPPKRVIPKRVPDAEGLDIKSLFEDGGALADLSSGLNPELKEQVIVPLTNLIEKYGIANEITNSPSAQNTANLLTLLVDVAPVIKGISDYVSGKKNSLDAEDKKFLEDILGSQKDGDFSELFIGEDVEEVVEEEKNPLFDLDKGPLNWEKIMDPEGQYFKTTTSVGDIGFNSQEADDLKDKFFDDAPAVSPFMSLEQLAAESGKSMDEIDSSDSNKKNSKENTTYDYNTTEVVDLISESLNNEIMDSIIDISSDEEIVYLSEEELQTLEEEGYEFEEVEEGVIVPNKSDKEDLVE
jgi:hypothetical protein